MIEIPETSNNNRVRWGECPYVVTYCLEKIVIYKVRPFLSRSRLHQSGKKNPDQEFYWSTNHEFYSRLGIGIVNQS